MRSAMLCSIALAGCVTTTEVRDELRGEIDKIKTKQFALESRFASVESSVRRIEQVRESLDRERAEAQEAARSEAKASSVDALREVRELRRELSESLDEAVARMRGDLNRLEGELRTADTERALRVQGLEADVAALKQAAQAAERSVDQAALDRLRATIETLEKTVTELGLSWQAKQIKVGATK